MHRPMIFSMGSQHNIAMPLFKKGLPQYLVKGMWQPCYIIFPKALTKTHAAHVKTTPWGNASTPEFGYNEFINLY